MRPVSFILLLGAASISAPACFNPPSEPVQFSCQPGDADECPPEYECRDDGCCHREDSPDGAAEGACKLSGGSAARALVSPGDTSSTGDSTGATGEVSAPTSAATTSTASTRAPDGAT